MTLSRREWIRCSGGLLALLALPVGCSTDGQSDIANASDDIRRIARQLQGFNETQWASSEPTEALVELIAEALRSRLAKGEPVEGALRSVIAEEHASNAVVEVQGWVLSKTEAKLLKLSARLHEMDGSSASGGRTPFGEMEEAELAQVERWGPGATCVGQPFNMQRDGHSSLWVALRGNAPPALEVAIGDVLLPTTRSGGLLTTRIDYAEFGAITGAAGALPVWLFDAQLERRQRIGEFVVEAAAGPATLADGSPSRVFQEVEDWGPRFATVLTPFNVRGDGSSAFWIRSQCAPAHAEAYLGTFRLRTVVGKDLITASLFELGALKEPGELPLYLIDKHSGERVLVGQFQILR